MLIVITSNIVLVNFSLWQKNRLSLTWSWMIFQKKY